jgi:hypothetical protein
MTRFCLILGLYFLFFSMPSVGFAYPHFIGYKYSSCLTCHYNGNGNGPLNDYGRALWSAEIAGKLFSGGKSDEELGESAGFLGKTQLPWWFRPGVKARYLEYQTNLGSANSDSRGILMQADVNAAIFFDQDQKYTVVASLGYVPEPLRFQNSPREIDTLISREHYFRWQKSEKLWFYFGMLDKVYGIRHANHTAFSRSRVGIAQNDQTHGVIGHYISENWELSVHGFAGNLYQDADLRQVGGSTMFEYEIKPAWRLGFSALNSSNDYVGNQRFAIHSRHGFGYGSAILFELGNIKNTPEGAGTATNGYYIYSEGIQKVARGYHITVTGQSYKADMVSAQPDSVKLGVGVLAFPMARTEFRFDLENSRAINAGAEVPNDSWALLMQVHLSL